MQSAVIPTAIPSVRLSVRPRLKIWHAAEVCLCPSSNPTRWKSGCGPGLGELPEIWGFPFNISAMAEASDYKLGIQLGFAKTHHKITARRQSGGCLGLDELLNILVFPYNIFATAGVSDFKFGMQLGFAKAHHKITRRKKEGHGHGLVELPKIWGLPFNIYTMAEASDLKFDTQLGFAKAHYKTTPTRKSGPAWPWAREAPIYLGFPIIISAAAALSS